MAANRSLGTLTLDLIAKVGGFVEPLGKAAREADKAAQGVKKSTKEMADSVDVVESRWKKLGPALAVGAAAAGAAVVAGLGAAALAVREFSQEAAQVNISSQISGTGVEEFQEFAYAAKTVGIESEKLGDIFKDAREKLGEFLEIGAGGMVDFFEQVAPRVGVTAEEFRNLSGPEVLGKMVQAMEEAGISAEGMSFYLESVASDTTALIPLLVDGGAELQRLGERAREAGVIMSQESVEAAVEFNSSMGFLKDTMKGTVTTMVSELMPALGDMAFNLAENSRELGTAEKAGQAMRDALDFLRVAFHSGNIALQAFIGVVKTGVSAINSMIAVARELGPVLDNLNIVGVLTGRLDEAINAAQAGMERARSQFSTEAKAWENQAAESAQASAKAIADINSGADRVRQERQAQERKEADARKRESDRELQAGVARINAQVAATKAQNEEAEKQIASMQRANALAADRTRLAEVEYDIAQGKYGVDAAIHEQLRATARQADQIAEAQAKSSASARSGAKASAGANKEAAAAAREAEKAAQEQARAVERLNEQYATQVKTLERRIALAGNESEVVALRYDLEHGELAKLSQAQKDFLVLKTQEAEAAEEAADATKKANDEASKALEDRAKKMEEVNARYKEYLADMAYEVKLLGLSRAEQERLDVLRDLGLDASSKSAEAITRTLDLYHAQRKAVEDQVDAMDELRGSFSGFLKDVASGSKSLKDALTDMLDSINARLMDTFANNLTEQLFGEKGTANSQAGGGEGFFSRLFGGLFGVRPAEEVAAEMPAGVDPFAQGTIEAVRAESVRMADGVIASVDMAMQTVAANVQATAMSSATGVEAMVGSTESTSNTASTAINQAMSGQGGFFSMLKGLFSSLVGMFSGGSGGGSGTAGMFSSIIGAFMGGRATGGHTNPFGIYRVNELGPELLSVGNQDYLMMGSKAGNVTPNHRMGGGGVTQVNNFQVHGRMDRRTETQIAASVGQRTNRAISRTV